MAAYESALNKMIIENDLKSDTALNEWASATANCGNPSNYFKKVQGDGCVFKTSDGIWWNISDIERPVISFKEINAGNEEQITTNANNANDKTAFVLVGRFGTDGSLRVDDLAYETANSVDDTNGYASRAQVEKLYKLLGLKSTSAGGETSEYTFASQRQKYLNGDFSTSCQELYGNDVDCQDGNNICKSCSVYYDNGEWSIVFDEEGNYFFSLWDCINGKNCTDIADGPNINGSHYDCDVNLTCYSSSILDERENMRITWDCDETGQNCSGIGNIKIKGDSEDTYVMFGACNFDASICSNNYGCMSDGLSCYDYADLKIDEETGEYYWSLKEQYRPTRNSNLTYSE